MTASSTIHEPRTTNAATRILRSDSLVLLLSAVLFAVLAPFTDGLASADNLTNLLGNMAP
ncbi:MAG: hypothetical protein RIS76_2117, partial [Verrucomicrobiota bacterium]